MFCIKRIILLAFLFAPLLSWSQDTAGYKGQMNELSVGIIGGGNTVSLNYGRVFLPRSKTFFVASIGMGIQPSGIFDPEELIFGIPHSVTFNYGGRGHYLELGAGANMFFATKLNATYYLPYPILGYRFQTNGSRRLQFVGRAFVHPRPSSDYWLFIPFGISLGIRF